MSCIYTGSLGITLIHLSVTSITPTCVIFIVIMSERGCEYMRILTAFTNSFLAAWFYVKACSSRYQRVQRPNWASIYRESQFCDRRRDCFWEKHPPNDPSSQLSPLRRRHEFDSCQESVLHQQPRFLLCQAAGRIHNAPRKPRHLWTLWSPQHRSRSQLGCPWKRSRVSTDFVVWCHRLKPRSGECIVECDERRNETRLVRETWANASPRSSPWTALGLSRACEIGRRG